MPKTQRWSAIVAQLSEQGTDAQGLTRSTLAASEHRLRELASDPIISHSMWLMGRIVQAARSDDFVGQVGRAGIDVSGVSTAVGFVSRVGDYLRDYAAERGAANVFGEIAGMALRGTLLHAIGHQGPGLFGASINDVSSALRPYGTQTRFGELGQRFFGNFLARTLTAFLDREAANASGPGGSGRDTERLQELASSIDRHAFQSARIIRDFAGEWFSKHDWTSGHDLSEDETKRFVGQALRKLRSELKREATA